MSAANRTNDLMWPCIYTKTLYRPSSHDVMLCLDHFDWLLWRHSNPFNHRKLECHSNHFQPPTTIATTPRHLRVIKLHLLYYTNVT
jgi:hypothetical protein